MTFISSFLSCRERGMAAMSSSMIFYDRMEKVRGQGKL